MRTAGMSQLRIGQYRGSSGREGIRAFLAGDVEHLEVTDQGFKPRDGMVVELSKAGEPSDEPRFKRSSGAIRITRIGAGRRRKSVGIRRVRTIGKQVGPRYQFACYACGKQVLKKSMDANIGPHKNEYGGECYSRLGHYIDTRW